MSQDEKINCWLSEASSLVAAIDVPSIAEAAQALIGVRNANGTIFVAGNGGSASTANHLALDLQKAGISPTGKRPKVISLFEKQLEALAEEGDSLLIISVSGSSPNLVRAVSRASDMGMSTVGFLGKNGGACRDLLDYPIILPSWDYGWVESGHMVLHHILTKIFHESEH
jgi:D-sedoheptulose 7-phosphate isomerase